MKVELDCRKSVHENAAVYYENSKKIRKKLGGLKNAIEQTKKLIALEEKRQAEFEEKAAKKKVVREKEWYEKFHWFFTSGGRLAVGGKDAKSNELIVKKHMNACDLYFHADIHGASSVVLQDGQKASDKELSEVAQFAACFSSAWKSGMEACDVFCVKPEQVKTAAKSGEYLASGSFVIEGKKERFKSQELRLGLVFELSKTSQVFVNNKLCVVPAVLGGIIIVPSSRDTKGESAKKVLKVLLARFPGAPIDINWVQEVLPNGGSKVILQN